MAERITQETYDKLQGDPYIVEARYDDQPNEVADRFIKVLGKMGIKVDALYPPYDIPHILYRIHPPIPCLSDDEEKEGQRLYRELLDDIAAGDHWGLDPSRDT